MSTMRIFEWDGQILITEGGQDWTNSSAIKGIVCSDVDDDDICEIVTVGYTAPMMMTPNSIMAIWSIGKAESQISLELSSEEITLGGQVIISGQLLSGNSTPIKNAEIRIEFAFEAQKFQTLTTVETDENGEFSYGWIPSEVGSYTIRAVWNGDFQHEGALNTTTLTVNKAPSVLAISLSSCTAKVGDKINVNGTLYPAQEATITIEYKLPDGTVTTKSVNSNSEGKFSDSFTVDQAGTWQVRAIWEGNDLYAGAESMSATVTVVKKKSEISIAASPLTIDAGETIAINGNLEPGQVVTITLTFTSPNGTIFTEMTQTNSAGAFSYTVKLNQAGVWQITASWNGNEEYDAAISNSVTVMVQALDTFTQIMMFAGVALGIIALIIAAVAMYMTSRKGVAQSPAQPSGGSIEKFD